MKKVLLVSEFTAHKSGYSIYGFELMKRLHNTGLFELAELAAYCSDDDPRINEMPWKVFPNQPGKGHWQEQHFNGEIPEHVFGGFRLEATLNEFRPDVVISFRDFWMDKTIFFSPFRDYFAFIEMPTVDAFPQHIEWLNAYKNADMLLTYQDWSKKELEKEGFEVFKSAPPVASDEYTFIPNKDELRGTVGLQNLFIVGMVARNQKRKLFPGLFKAFQRFSKNKEDAYLYLHTGYPDNGWEIPTLLKEFSLENKTIFTYFCSCGYKQPKIFSGEKTFCPRCGRNEMLLVQPNRGIDNSTMNHIYNIFDVYVQYCSNEGFGMPTGEAACCGLPVMGTNYSSLEDILEKIDGIRIKCSLNKEIETGRNFAIPDEDDFIDKLEQLYMLPREERLNIGIRTRENYLKNYSWEKTTQVWIDAINSVEAKKSWDSEPNFHQPVQYDEKGQLDSYSYAAWLIINVLGDKTQLNTFMHSRLARDLDRGMWNEVPNGGYYEEKSHMFTKNKWAPFDRQTAYRILLNKRNNINECEKIRVNR